MNATPDNWGKAYARQALADFHTWQGLQGVKGVPPSEKLHLLQMVCEKLCKAHLCKQPGADPADYQSSHAYTAKNLAIVVRQQISLTRHPPKNGAYLLERCRHLAREIELLHPSVEDGGKRPDNCEYPWQTGDQVYVPAEWTFPVLNLLEAQGGTTLLKIIQDAIQRLAA